MTKTTKKRTRRTPEQMVADLEAEIERVKARAAAKEAKQNPAGKALISAVRAIDKALELAKQQKEGDIVRALEASRAPLCEALVAMGVRLPVRRRR